MMGNRPAQASRPTGSRAAGTGDFPRFPTVSNRAPSTIQSPSNPRCRLIRCTSLRISGSFSRVSIIRTCSL